MKNRENEKPEVYAVRKSTDESGMSRREFVKLGAAAVGAGMLLGGAGNRLYADDPEQEMIALGKLAAISAKV